MAKMVFKKYRQQKLLAKTIIVVSLLISVMGCNGSDSPNFNPEDSQGLNSEAKDDLVAAGMTKYVGKFSPALSVDADMGWVKHTYDSEEGEGPICIDGTDYSIFTKVKNPDKLLITLQGGGACWQDFYYCKVNTVNDTAPEANGIFADSYDTGENIQINPLADWSVVELGYCDGSAFTGDNELFDSGFPGGKRYHRGLRNLTAGIDLAKTLFPDASRVMVAGVSAGGYGAAAYAPLLTRMAYGNSTELTVINDSGPTASNLNNTEAIEAWAYDWQYGQFFPSSCEGCDVRSQGFIELIKWRLDNDTTIREAFVSTDGDSVVRFFLSVPTQWDYRTLILEAHGSINDAYPDRYKRFIQSGNTEHTALSSDSFYTRTVLEVPLYVWMTDFLESKSTWEDVVDEYVEASQAP